MQDALLPLSKQGSQRQQQLLPLLALFRITASAFHSCHTLGNRSAKRFLKNNLKYRDVCIIHDVWLRVVFVLLRTCSYLMRRRALQPGNEPCTLPCQTSPLPSPPFILLSFSTILPCSFQLSPLSAGLASQDSSSGGIRIQSAGIWRGRSLPTR
jgi:hypothetical protein